MDFDELNKILDIVRQHELSEFELEREGFKIKIRKGTLIHAQIRPRRTMAAPVPHAPAPPAPLAGPCASAADAQRAQAPRSIWPW